MEPKIKDNVQIKPDRHRKDISLDGEKRMITDQKTRETLEKIKKIDPVKYAWAEEYCISKHRKFYSRNQKEAWLDGYKSAIQEVDNTEKLEKCLLIYHIMKLMRKKKRGPKREMKRMREILGHYDNGETIPEVAERYGVTVRTIHYWNKELKEYGFEVKHKNAPKRKKRPV